MRALEDMRGALTPDEDAVFHGVCAKATPRDAGYLSGRRLTGIPAVLAKAEADLADVRDSRTLDERTRNAGIEYCERVIAGWKENAK